MYNFTQCEHTLASQRQRQTNQGNTRPLNSAATADISPPSNEISFSPQELQNVQLWLAHDV